MRFFVFLITLAVLTSVSFDSHAQERWPRWYVGLSAGVDFLEDSDLSGPANGDLDYDAASNFNASIGYIPFAETGGWNGFRIEAELGYRQAGLDSFSNNGTLTAAREELHVVSYMANLYYDIRNTSQWTPYLGAGVGGAHVRLSENSGIGNIVDSDRVLAYQFMAGFTYAPETMPLTEWGLGYRYFVADSPTFAATGPKLKLDDITSHGIEANARFRF